MDKEKHGGGGGSNCLKMWRKIEILVHHSLLSKTMEQEWKKEQKDKYHGLPYFFMHTIPKNYNSIFN